MFGCQFQRILIPYARHEFCWVDLQFQVIAVGLKLGFQETGSCRKATKRFITLGLHHVRIYPHLFRIMAKCHSKNMWFQQNCQVGAKEPQRYCSSDLHCHRQTEEYHRARITSEAAQLEDQNQQFRNKCNSFPCLDYILDKLFTGQKPVYIEKHTWQPRDRKYYCRRWITGF